MAGRKKKFGYSSESRWFPKSYFGWIIIGNRHHETSSVYLGRCSVSSNLPKQQQKKSRISALALKRGLIKRVLYTANWLSYTTFFIWPFLEAIAEILEKIYLVSWEILRHKKDILKSTDLNDNKIFCRNVQAQGWRQPWQPGCCHKPNIKWKGTCFDFFKPHLYLRMSR